MERRDEPVTFLGNRLDETRAVTCVSERRANLRDAVRQAAIEIDVGVFPPDRLFQFVPRDELIATVKQKRQRARRLGLERNQTAGFAQPARIGLEFEDAKAIDHGTADCDTRRSRKKPEELDKASREQVLLVLTRAKYRIRAVSRWKAWIYLPFGPIAWGLACAALLVLTALGASPLRPGALTQDLTRSGVIAVLGSSAVVNIILFWRQVRPRYLTAATARRAFVTTLALLTIVVTASAFAS